MDAGKVAQLRLFVEEIKSNPSILNDPSLVFFKDYLQSLGARFPRNPESKDRMSDGCDDVMADVEENVHSQTPDQGTEADDIDDEIVESDVELDGEVVEPDNDPPQKMGDPSVEISEDNRETAQTYKAKALHAISEGELNEAVDHLTEAIMLNPSSAILYATRAHAFVKMNKPNAAIRDADEALKINSDLAKGYKYRGMARAMLGQWEEAANDLHIASKLDYDDEIYSILKKVEPNAHKLKEHQRKYERLRKELELRKAERLRRRRRAEVKAAYEREKRGQTSQSNASDPGPQDPDSLAALKDGTVLSIHSSSELETKFKAASNLSRLVVLYFTATWCGPCRFIAPLFSSLAGKYPKVVFLKVDIDELGHVAQRWDVNSVPTFFFIRNGKQIDKVLGADKNELEKKLTLYAGKS
ncbi:TPR repeat-containing thioredoxin TDX [Acorus gramineus]|uniref:TPR repeat-containing thioredoxin TDX n=1 Tax=Acorus gramineus TaxID=55184 RepID=A0AAV9BQX2_ACOGR|nr:TPR repeat-containing thioredoxin TDX [Acorus gramineus]